MDLFVKKTAQKRYKIYSENAQKEQTFVKKAQKETKESKKMLENISRVSRFNTKKLASHDLLYYSKGSFSFVLDSKKKVLLRNFAPSCKKTCARA